MSTIHPGGDAGLTPPSPVGPIRTARGAYRVIAILTAVMMVIGGFALTASIAGADAGSATRTTDRLKLRAAPALNAEILDVIPAGEPVDVLGDPENGFYPVAWNDQSGYAYGAYLTGGGVEGGPVTTGGQTGEVNVVDGPVNFRTGPSTADSVISVIPDGALVALNGDSANGFVAILYTDRSGWAHAESVLGTGEGVAPAPSAEQPLAPEPPAEETETPEIPEALAPEPVEEEPAATDSVPVGDTVTGSATVVDGGLNLRTGPGAEYPVVLVMPDGSPVELRGAPQNGYYPVSFDGTTGWAAADYLGFGEEPEAPAELPAEEPAVPAEPEPTESPAEEPPVEPETPPVDGSDGYTEDEIIEIIYAAADMYGQPREDMLRVARCESVLDPNAVNASSGASGLFQFLPSTWATTPYADQDIFDPVANAEAAAWMWDNGRRNEWTCQ